MSSFFSTDNKLMAVMSKIFDLMMLGLVWLLLCVWGFSFFISTMSQNSILLWLISAVLCLPVGPMTTAMYYTIVKVIRHERSYVHTEFWRSLKLNLKQGLVLSVIFSLFAIVLYVDFSWVNTVEGTLSYGKYLRGAFLVLLVMFVFVFIYSFPILSRFSVKTKQLLKWSFFLSIRHLPLTVIMTAILAGAVVGGYFCFFYFFPAVLVLPAVATLLISFPMEIVLKKYTPEAGTETIVGGTDSDSEEEREPRPNEEEMLASDEKDPNNDGVDRWYNE